MRVIAAVLVAALLSAGTASGAAAVGGDGAPGPQVRSEAESVFQFARHLERGEEYYRAVTEYERFLFLFPDHPLALEARYRKARCFIEGRKWAEATATLKELEDLGHGEYSPRAALARVETDYRRGMDDEVLLDAGLLRNRFPASREAGLSLRYEALSNFRRGFDRAARLSAEAGSDSWLKDLASSIEAAEACDPAKKPWLAGTLSAVLPGAGQLYLGRRKDALNALFLNALFIFAMVESSREKEYGLFAVFTVFEIGWYAGNVYGAVSGTHKYNRLRFDGLTGPAAAELFRAGDP